MSEANQNATTAAKNTKGKAAKKAAKPKAATPKTKVEKAVKPTKERPPREDRSTWGTFALKMPVLEREAFHAAAGPANASRVARTVLVAFANEDEGAFRNAITEANKLRA